MDQEFEGVLEPTLEELVNIPTMKWIFVGGKGGVGKTTTSCSLAVELAKRKESVLIVSTDPAHNLSDAFSQKFTRAPTLVNGFTNLYAMEVQPKGQEIEFKLPQDEDNDPMSDITKVIKGLLPELMSSLPGIDEALSFAELISSVQSMNYSVILFDTAPTGHTLRLLGFPDILEKAFSKLAELRQSMSGALNMMNMMSGPNAPDMTAQLDEFRAVTAAVRARFQDPTATTFVCVCIPEFLSVYETERLVQELIRQNIDCSNIVVNQVLFPIEGTASSTECKLKANVDVTSASSEEMKCLSECLKLTRARLEAFEKNYTARRRMQSKYLSQIQDLYSMDFHIVPMAMMSTEVRGVPLLNEFGRALLSKRPLPILEEGN